MIQLTAADPRYPRRLRDLVPSPDPLWIEGDVAALDQGRAVAVVGTRRMSPYGERIAREIAGPLAAAGAVVVSGLAQGIDATAHAAALESGLTVAVLGEGIASFMRSTRGPRGRLARRIVERGALVSEFPPDAGAQRWTFAKRNATVAALADAVVVIEAPHGSGALITAGLARRLGRPLYAVPGPLGARCSAGTNELIAERLARAIVDVPSFLREIGLAAPSPTAARSSPLLEALAHGPAQPDVVAARIGCRPEEVAQVVARALLAGEIIALPDGRFARR